MLVIVDADALIAMSVPTDIHRLSVEALIRKFQANGVQSIYPTTAICEALTVLKRRKEEDASRYTRPLDMLLETVKTGRLKTYPIDKEIVLAAIANFAPNGRSSDSFFDSIVATLAIRYRADAVFSFDKVYKRMGLRLAKDLFP